jgi:hypothetical protein
VYLKDGAVGACDSSAENILKPYEGWRNDLHVVFLIADRKKKQATASGVDGSKSAE